MKLMPTKLQLLIFVFLNLTNTNINAYWNDTDNDFEVLVQEIECYADAIYDDYDDYDEYFVSDAEYEEEDFDYDESSQSGGSTKGSTTKTNNNTSNAENDSNGEVPVDPQKIKSIIDELKTNDIYKRIFDIIEKRYKLQFLYSPNKLADKGVAGQKNGTIYFATPAAVTIANMKEKIMHVCQTVIYGESMMNQILEYPHTGLSNIEYEAKLCVMVADFG